MESLQRSGGQLGLCWFWCPIRKWWQVRDAVLAEAWALTKGAPLGSQATQQPSIHTKVTTANQELVLRSEHVDGQVSRRAAPTTADVSLL